MVTAAVQGIRPESLAVLALVVALAIAASIGPAPVSAGGATIVVNTLNDEDPIVGNGECSLREAIVNANNDDQVHGDCASGAAADTITFGVTGTIILETALPSITDEDGLTIDGGGSVTVDGDNDQRVFVVDLDGVLTLEHLTVTNGYTSDAGGGIFNSGVLTLNNSTVSASLAEDARGGGIYNNGGTVTLMNSSVSGNSVTGQFPVGGDGGGIYNHGGGVVTLTNGSVDGNEADEFGGGIYNASGGEVTLTGSTVSGNEAELNGGGIYSSGDDVTLTESTVNGNIALENGGGIYNTGSSGPVILNRSTVSGNQATTFNGGGIYIHFGGSDHHLANSTVSGNTAGDRGGGVYLEGTSAGEITLTNATVSDNASADEGGGIYNSNGIVRLSNTIVADQQSGGDCEGINPSSEDHNLDSDDSCDLNQDNDLPAFNANLGPLSDNGGPTLTHRLLEGSDAIDAGDDAVCAAKPVDGVDQRGAPRPHGKACDIGAFELGAVIPLWGDVDCDGNVVIGDALKTARYLLGLSVSQEPGCPLPGADVTVDGADRTWGDVDCDESVAIGDALKIARWLLGLSVSQEEGCPEIGTEVFIGS